MIDLSSYGVIQSNLFVKIEVDYYKTTSESTPTSVVLAFSDRPVAYTLEGQMYAGTGRLMGVTTTASELRISNYEITVTLGGVPDSSLLEIINSKIKGSPIEVRRALFDNDTTTLLAIEGNPILRFKGIVNNYALTEEFDGANRTGTNTIILTCTSEVDIISNKISGRRTNPDSQKSLYPGDVSFDRVPNLKNTAFNFGA